MRSKKPEHMLQRSDVFVDGYIERCHGTYEGILSVEGINLSPITGTYFKENGGQWLWIKRKEILQYDISEKKYKKKKPAPFFECYMKKQLGGEIAYKGYFYFSHLKFAITGIYDKYLKDVDRLNLYIERVPMSEQNIINNINQRNTKKDEKRQRNQE